MADQFGIRLHELRKQKGWTQEQLGSLINVSDVTINRYEKGNREPGSDTLMRLADIFQVSVDYLLGRATPDKQELPLDRNNRDAFVERVASLGEKERKAIESLLDFREEKEEKND